jgi:nucleoside 2-deoxyribosyltransferase
MVNMERKKRYIHSLKKPTYDAVNNIESTQRSDHKMTSLTRLKITMNDPMCMQAFHSSGNVQCKPHCYMRLKAPRSETDQILAQRAPH